MALPIRSSLIPQCTSCTRRLTSAVLSNLRPTYARVQVRGKKKLANIPDTIIVKLKQHVPTFGKRGAYVPVTAGQMRNIWFPGGVARYVTTADMKQLKSQNADMERDYAFRAELVAKKGRRSSEAEPVDELTAFRQSLGPQRTGKEPKQKQVEVEKITVSRAVFAYIMYMFRGQLLT